jgi:hypothetical protein
MHGDGENPIAVHCCKHAFSYLFLLPPPFKNPVFPMVCWKNLPYSGKKISPI